MVLTEKRLTTEEAAARLQLKPRTVTKYAQEGKLKGFKVGKGWQFSEEVITAFLREQVAESHG